MSPKSASPPTPKLSPARSMAGTGPMDPITFSMAKVVTPPDWPKSPTIALPHHTVKVSTLERVHKQHTPPCHPGLNCVMCEASPHIVSLTREDTPPGSPSPASNQQQDSHQMSHAWQFPPRFGATPAAQPSPHPEEADSPAQPFSYAFILPCPGEGLGGTWEYCASGNLCYQCQLCKVCKHCSPSCPGYIDLAPNSPGFSSMTLSVSIDFFERV